MPYRMRYSVNVDWVGPGQGPMGGGFAALQGSEAGGAQTLEFLNTPGGQNVAGAGAGGIINAADITTLTNAMAADVAAQMNVAAVLARMQGFATGGG